MNDEFYVGYLPKAPTSLARIVPRTATALIAIGAAVAGLLIFNQPPFDESKFEYGEYREYSGTIEEWPYPMLVTNDGRFLLVAPGKHGLTNAARGLQGRSFRLTGSLIERGTNRMLEVVPGSMHEVPPGQVQNTTRSIDLGPVRLRGEIVDSKCYLGVMNPGSGKVHRDCAARCISGGAPPAFIATDASGYTRTLLLVDAKGKALGREVLPFVAEPLEIRGQLVRAGSTLVLEVDPSRFCRLSGINPAAECIR